VNLIAFEPHQPTAGNAEQQPATVDHIADCYKRYPSETVRFITRLHTESGLGESRLTVELPGGLELIEFLPLDDPHAAPMLVRDLEQDGGGSEISWQISGLAKGETLVFTTVARVLPHDASAYLACRAVLRDAIGFMIAEETAQVAVRARSAYIQFLPEIYRDDGLANRLLMLVESFWKPVDQQISQPDIYYDTQLAPPVFLDWLASWIGMPVDETLPIERRRKLLSSALALYQRTGTRQAIGEYLHLYTGGEVEIIEHRAQNMLLGPSTRLGLAIALGRYNLPNTFTVRLRVPWVEIQRYANSFPAGRNERAAALSLYRRRIETVIEAQKPAHTAFHLELQVVEE
jgi:phage tail-like protein